MPCPRAKSRLATVDGWRVEVLLRRRRDARVVEEAVGASLGPTVGRDGKTVYADAGSWPQAEHMRLVFERAVAALDLDASVAVTRRPNG
jgi:hypothetical protein